MPYGAPEQSDSNRFSYFRRICAERGEGDLALDRFLGTNWKAGADQLERSLGSLRHLYRSDDDPASRNSPLLADGDE